MEQTLIPTKEGIWAPYTCGRRVAKPELYAGEPMPPYLLGRRTMAYRKTWGNRMIKLISFGPNPTNQGVPETWPLVL
jgi:hypothetical protein